MYRNQLPDLDIVIIGVNVATTLAACLDSVMACDYPAHKRQVYFVDGGSTDTSASIAASYSGVRVLSLGLEHPTPGLGRNVGFREGKAPLVLFLDGDTRLDPHFPRRAVDAFREDVGAVMGIRKERATGASIFNWLGDLEWTAEPAMRHRPSWSASCFGGDVMLRRDVLQAAGCYHPALVAGEDPEVSRRIRAMGFTLLQLNIPMTDHDLNMHGLRAYCRRAFRSGHAFAEVRRLLVAGDDFWQRENRRIHLRAGAFLFLLMISIITAFISWPVALFFTIPAFGCLCSPMLRLQDFRRRHRLTWAQAALYGLHCSLVVLPQAAGAARFHWGLRRRRPLRNHVPKLSS